MTHIIRSLILGIAPALLGSLLALPGMAQLVEDPSGFPPPAESQPASQKLPAAELNKWPPSQQPVELVLYLSERQLYVYRGETIEKAYPVAVCKAGWETPTGTFEGSYMLENPGWTNPFTGAVMPPGPDNPLGERWIAFWTDGHNEIGFHGTPNQTSIGQAASHGCVRMHNEHIRELYDLVAPGTLVTVLP